MPILNRELADTINTEYRNIWDEAIEGNVQPLLQREGLFYEVTGVNAAQLDLAWMRSYTRMREWIGERQINDAEMFSHLMYNTKYEGTVQTRVEDIEDGVYALKATTELQDLAESYEIRKAEEFHRLLMNGFTDTNTLDGVPLFDDAHPYGRLEFDDSRPRGEKWVFNQEGTFDNLSDAALSEDALWAARRNFQTYRNHMGEPAVSIPDVLVVGPQNERTARVILERSVKADGSENETQGLFRTVVDPRISGPEWFLFNSSGRRKPFVFWNRVPLQLQAPHGPANANVVEGSPDQYVFMNDALLHGARARMGFGYGLPEYSFGSTGTV